MAAPLRTVNLEDKKLQYFQDNVARAVDPLLAKPLADTRFLADLGDGLERGIALAAASTTLIPHGLNRVPRGWRLVDNVADSRVWRDTTAALPERYLALKCSADTTVKLEVF